MPPSSAPQALALLAGAALALWIAFVSRGRHAVPGSVPFAWLQLAIALWCLTGALHALATPLAAQIVWAKVQYFGIASVPPLWLLFTTQYGRVPLVTDRWHYVVLWTVPVLMVGLAVTNEWHHWLWTSITALDNGRVVYEHGPAFWIAVAQNYTLLIGGTLVLVRSIRRFPTPYHRQSAALIAGAVVPWTGNIAYLSGATPPGLDPTPVAFVVSGLCFAWGMFRYQLFELVPIARDLLFDSMSDAVLVLDPNRRIVDHNQAALVLPGARGVEIGATVDQALAWWSDAATFGEAFDGTAVVVTTGPERRSLEVRVVPVRGTAGQFSGWLVVVRDVTDRVRAEEDRRVLDERLRGQEKRESLSVLAGGLAHDFNNLLTGILGNAELVSMSLPGNSPFRDHLATIITGSQRAADLVSKMLAYAGEGRVIAGMVDIDALTDDVVGGGLSRTGVIVHHDRVGPLPPVHGDVMQIRQAIANVITNAIEATPSGGEVIVATGVETLSAEALLTATLGNDRAPGTYAFVEVRDTGAGMDEATLPRIFDPFFSTRDLGRGLGLAAAQGIIRSHDGALRVDSAPGTGTTIRLWFPVANRPA
ncbi:MAG: histidine kinase N-terminal 7TM domain-containing protein [Vicinamibacterales bacterium]|nr:histidine kinase N-terminal 7TM domain-containing protein [Vicinamibacterales bacterium]